MCSTDCLPMEGRGIFTVDFVSYIPTCMKHFELVSETREVLHWSLELV